MSTIYREVTPLTQPDCFCVFSRVKSGFDLPLHYHDEFELIFVANAGGGKRIVGDHSEVIDDLELVLVGHSIPHGWFDNPCERDPIQEISIQFHKDLFDNKLLNRNQLSFMRTLLERSSKGILFSRETIQLIRPRLEALVHKSGFDSVLELLSILHDLSISRNMRTLSAADFTDKQITYSNRRLEQAFAFMQSNYSKDITLNDVARTVNMLDVSFSRFIKKRTGKTFIESMNDIRLSHAARLLIDTTLTITDISFTIGFNNLSYFNRIFRRKHDCTPREFRTTYSGVRVII